MVNVADNSKPYEKFNIGTFIIALLGAALMLVILPVGFIFRSEIILWAALVATAMQFIAIYKMTAARLFE